MFTKLDHVGIVVRDLDKALALYRDMLNLKLIKWGVIEKPEQGVRIALLHIGDGFLELLQPTGGDGRIGRRLSDHLEEKGEGLFHISIFAEGYKEEIAALEAKGYALEEELVDFVGGIKLRFAFLSPSQTAGVWIEIVDASCLPSG